MAKYQRHEPVIHDSTAIVTAKTCFRKYFYKIVLGFRAKGNPPYIAFGSCYHEFREVLEKTQSLDQALDAAATMWEKIGRNPPVGADYDFLTGERLFKSCMVAHEHWLKEKKNGRIQVIAVEQEFVVTLKDGTTRTGGRADQIVRWNGKLWGRDFKATTKTSAYYQRLLDPNDQFTRYTLAEGKLCGEEIQGQLIELMFNTRKEGPKVVPLSTGRTPGQLSRWEDEQIFFEKLLDQCRNEDVWPMCEAHCPFCEYHSVCKQVNEGGMMSTLESNFSQIAWDFTRAGEE